MLPLERSLPMWKRLTLEGKIVENQSVSPSLTLDKNEILEHYINVKDPIIYCFRF